MPYRVVDVALWTDPRVKKLSVRGKLLFLYLITNPHTHVGGLYYLPDVMIQHETGLAAKDIDTLWDTLSKLGLARRDRPNEIVWVCNMFRYQGVHQKTVISVSHHLNTLHNSPLCKEFAERYPEVLTVKNGYRTDRVSEVGFSDQEQEQEQEQEQNTPPSPPRGDVVEIPLLLDTPAFRVAWEDWISYRRSARLKAYTPQGLTGQFNRLLAWGVERAIAAIRLSIAQGWQGIHEDKNAGRNGTTGHLNFSGQAEFLRRGKDTPNDS